jgi:hypothetical protein
MPMTTDGYAGTPRSAGFAETDLAGSDAVDSE